MQGHPKIPLIYMAYMLHLIWLTCYTYYRDPSATYGTVGHKQQSATWHGWPYATVGHMAWSARLQDRSRGTVGHTACTVATLYTIVHPSLKPLISGRILCTSRPMADIKVDLIKPGYIYDSYHAPSTVTDQNGLFLFRSDDQDTVVENLSIKVTYLFDRGNYSRKIAIVDDLKFIRHEIFTIRKKDQNRQQQQQQQKLPYYLGEFSLKDDHCLSYGVYRHVMLEYENQTGLLYPHETLYVISASLGGAFVSTVPFASTDTIRIPFNYEHIDDLDSGRHEFAHTLRHTYDGSFWHLLYDTAKFEYVQNHWCRKRTNPGFAFNEGFAEFFTTNLCDIGQLEDKLDFNYEDNVAHALRRLAAKCHGENLNSGKRAFVILLEKNPDKIHTFYDFDCEHEKFYGCSFNATFCLHQTGIM
uniref:Uncharacterized protein n=1 Tax=Romanomermis culicivorax TaxID=13658 RepID=A0A915K5I7_ROMCU